VAIINFNFKVGDLVVLEETIVWMKLTIIKGEICMITEIYDNDSAERFFNCSIISADGIQLDVWFAEIKKLENE